MSHGARLETLLVSDLVESTRLVDRVGDARATEIFIRHDGAARALLAEQGGREIDKTDGFLLLFDRPVAAVRYAMAYHRLLAELAREYDVRLAARVGVHLGEVHVRPNPPEQVARGAKPLEVEGLAKVIAARLMALAGAGQTLLSRTAYEVARRATVGDPAEQLEWRVHGSYRLKGVADPVEVCEVGVAGEAPLAAPASVEKAERVGPAARPGVLVLPFASLAGNGDIAHICDGLTDEIITSLSGIGGLRVISRTASMQLRGTDKDSKTLGRDLNVQYVLAGTVKQAAGALRISSQLVRTDSDEVLWARRHSGRLEQIFEIEEAIARTIVEALELELTAGEEQKLAQRPIPNAAAYDYYLRAKQEIYQCTEESLDRALELLEKGVALLGDNVPLYAALGSAYFQYVNLGIRPDPAYLDRARGYARMILELDPDSPAGHRLLGLVEIHAKGEIQLAVRHLKRALAGDPNDPDTLFWLAALYGFTGRASSGQPLADRLLEIDPITPLYRLMPGLLALLEGDFEGADRLLRPVYDADPANPVIAQIFGQVQALLGRPDDAHAVLDRLAAELPDHFFTGLGRCLQHALRGDAERLAATVTGLVEEGAATDMQYSWNLAECYALVGNEPEALRWLANAVKYGNTNYPLLAERDPLLQKIRDTEGFRALMQNVRQRWQSFEA